ncbi:MAG: sulfur oxidation c-type cytochrome SoxX, partial [Pseudomonadota bacterium]
MIRRIVATGFVALAMTGIVVADVTAPEDVKIENLMINASLTGKPGSAEEGRNVFSNRKLGNCLACHQNS